MRQGSGLVLQKRKLFVFVAPDAAKGKMLELAARLAENGPVRLFDGGNCLDVYKIAQFIRRMSIAVEEVMGRIHLSRVFSCYQMTALLKEAVIRSEPLLIFNFLATFYDENVSLVEAQRLLKIAMQNLVRLNQAAPIVMGARLPRFNPERGILLKSLREISTGWYQRKEESDPALLEKNWPQLPLPFQKYKKR